MTVAQALFCRLLQHFTQYIPLAVCELHLWMGSPSIYVFDCSNAGCIVEYVRKNVPLIRDQQDTVNFQLFLFMLASDLKETQYICIECIGNISAEIC